MSRIQKKSFGDNDAVFGRRGGLNIKNTLLRTLIRRNSGAYCAIVQHLANDKRKFVVKHVMDPLVAAGGKLYLSDDSGIRELKPSRQKDLLLIITKIQQALRDEKKKIMKKMEKKQSKSSKSNKGSSSSKARTTLSRDEHNAITTPSLYVFAAAEDHALSALPPLAVTPSMVPVPAGNNNGSLYPSPTQEEDESTTTTASSYGMTPMPRARTRQQKRRASSLNSVTSKKNQMTTRAPVYSVPSVSPTLELGSRPAPPEEEEEDSSTSEEEHEETDDEEEEEQFEDAPEEEEEDTTSPQEQEEDISNATPMTDEVDHDMVKSLFGALRTGNWVQG